MSPSLGATSDRHPSVPLTKGKEHFKGKVMVSSAECWEELMGLRTEVGLEIGVFLVTPENKALY